MASIAVAKRVGMKSKSGHGLVNLIEELSIQKGHITIEKYDDNAESLWLDFVDHGTIWLSSTRCKGYQLQNLRFWHKQ